MRRTNPFAASSIITPNTWDGINYAIASTTPELRLPNFVLGETVKISSIASTTSAQMLPKLSSGETIAANHQTATISTSTTNSTSNAYIPPQLVLVYIIALYPESAFKVFRLISKAFRDAVEAVAMSRAGEAHFNIINHPYCSMFFFYSMSKKAVSTLVSELARARNWDRPNVDDEDKYFLNDKDCYNQFILPNFYSGFFSNPHLSGSAIVRIFIEHGHHEECTSSIKNPIHQAFFPTRGNINSRNQTFVELIMLLAANIEKYNHPHAVAKAKEAWNYIQDNNLLDFSLFISESTPEPEAAAESKSTPEEKTSFDELLLVLRRLWECAIYHNLYNCLSPIMKANKTLLPKALQEIYFCSIFKNKYTFLGTKVYPDMLENTKKPTLKLDDFPLLALFNYLLGPSETQIRDKMQSETILSIATDALELFPFSLAEEGLQNRVHEILQSMLKTFYKDCNLSPITQPLSQLLPEVTEDLRQMLSLALNKENLITSQALDSEHYLERPAKRIKS